MPYNPAALMLSFGQIRVEDKREGRVALFTWFSVVAAALSRAACAQPLKVDRLNAEALTGQPKVLSLLTGSGLDADVRRSLARNGFKVVRFAARTSVEQKVTDTRTETYNEAEPMFGLSVYPGAVVDRCLTHGSVKLGKATYEVTDLRTNEIIVYVEAGGWTGPCGFADDLVWDDLSVALAAEWR